MYATVPAVINPNLSHTHNGDDSRGCITGPLSPLSSNRNQSGRARVLAAHKQRPPESGLSQHQVSVRREAVHIRASRFKLIKRCRLFYVSEPNGRLPMKRLMIPAFAAVTLFAAAT